MEKVFSKLNHSVKHLETLHQVFKKRSNFSSQEQIDCKIYLENLKKFRQVATELGLQQQLYGQADRQMILADLIEYIYLGRGYYSMQKRGDKKQKQAKQRFIKLILYLVNLLMTYETLTVSQGLRKKFLKKLSLHIPEIKDEALFSNLLKHSGKVGLTREESDASKQLDKYFDSILPKTAGGLWHELLVFIFLLRNDLGYIIPLLLSQRLIGLKRNIVPPDFLIITHSKQLFGVEVGTKKEIQSGSFSLQTSIPTATINTIDSRASDRCPICHKWLQFCNFVIDKYSDFDYEISKHEVRCLEECTLCSKQDIAEGVCSYTKYSRNLARTRPYAQHSFVNKKKTLHYHYKCVLDNVPQNTRNVIIRANDTIALKTHYLYYPGLEELIQKES